MEKNMTALFSLYARAYHTRNNDYKIYNDKFANKIISDEEYNNISLNLCKGIKFFDKSFKGSDDEALKLIVNKQLSPSVIGRSKYASLMLNNAIRLGCKQYLVFAAGYDTSAYELGNEIKVFELDQEEMIDEKVKRLCNAGILKENVSYVKCDFTCDNWLENLLESGYDKQSLSFSTLLGISYYLTKDEFKKMLENISLNITDGSSLVFDYQTEEIGDEVSKNSKLATAANSEMKATYSLHEITKILEECDFLIYECLDNKLIDQNIFDNYNVLNPRNQIKAPVGINYILAVKKI